MKGRIDDPALFVGVVIDRDSFRSGNLMLHYRKDLCILVFAKRQQRRERQCLI
jgi:hypothetical protein